METPPTYFDWLTVAAIVIGPLSAVGITLWNEHRRRKREARTQILKMLLNTWAVPSDPAFTVGMNMILVEFNDRPKIMAARRAYVDQAWNTPTAENVAAHDTQMSAKLSALTHEITKELGFDIPESDIKTQTYIAKGYVDNALLQEASLRATCSIAESLHEQTGLLKVQTAEPETKS